MGEPVAMAPIGEVLACLSHALDLVEGQPRGHGVRTSMIAVRLAQRLGLDQESVTKTFYASILKDTGCSSNAARIFHFFGGDERDFKYDAKLVDWTNSLESFRHALTHIAPGASLSQKLVSLARLARKGPSLADEVVELRCHRGAAIARALGFDEDVAMAVHCLDEHFDGRGSPAKLVGDQIPVLAQVIGLAQTMDVFVTAFGVGECMEMIRRRRRKWFGPEVADAGISLEAEVELWREYRQHLAGEEVPLPVGSEALVGVKTSVEDVCHAFAQIIDAKSAFTGEHSTRVAEYAGFMGRSFGFQPERLVELDRAALLHDIGKLGVSNSILEKPGRLTDDEFGEIRKHPEMSSLLLGQIRGFERITELASTHHERLDGRGYWRGLGSEALDLDMRILTAADVFDALTAKRPYRDAMPVDEALEIMERDSGTAFDARCLDVLRGWSSCENRRAA